MLTDHCRSCPKRSSCVALCPEMEALIPPQIPDRVDKFSKEIPASARLQRLNEQREEDNEPLTEDEYYDSERGIDPAARFGADSDLDVEWHKDSPLYLEADLASEDYKFFKELIHTQLRSPIQKNRLKAFLGCESLTNIARRSSTSKQNIQKQISRIIGRLARRIAQQEVPKQLITPHQLKKRYQAVQPADGF
jgi:hypothetical protein